VTSKASITCVTSTRTIRRKKGFRTLFSGKVKEQTNENQILVNGDENTSRVDVMNKDGTPEQSKTSERILTLLYDQLK
jgi:outer membrane protein assembly factor BamC